jgi:hypothetical protein
MSPVDFGEKAFKRRPVLQVHFDDKHRPHYVNTAEVAPAITTVCAHCAPPLPSCLEMFIAATVNIL